MQKIIPQYKLYDYKIERNDMNKYQEALNSLWEIFKYKFKTKEIDKAQKLIECKEQLQQAIDRLELVEKALEKACKELNRQFYCHERYECPNKDKETIIENCEKCVKEYLLKESENNNV